MCLWEPGLQGQEARQSWLPPLTHVPERNRRPKAPVASCFEQSLPIVLLSQGLAQVSCPRKFSMTTCNTEA